MTTLGRRAPFLLFIGDIAAFAVALYLTLWVRYGALPTEAVIRPYVMPFILIFGLWTLVFYMAGLYGKRLALFPSRVPDALLKTQFLNIVLAALVFFFIPAFGITPKTILLLYLVSSLALIYFWRLALYPRFTRTHAPERAMLIAVGSEADELAAEVNGNPRYGIEFCCLPAEHARLTPETFEALLEKERPSVLVFDEAYDGAPDLIPVIYRLTHVERRFQFAAFEDVYEEIFDRIPLSRLGHAWFLENVASASAGSYVLVKRLIDLVGGVLMGLVTLVVLPFVALALQLEWPGQIFIVQERIGQYGTRIRAYKFRTMRFGDRAVWNGEDENTVSRVGGLLRKVSLDEFPQFINILTGELSLVGPRNDVTALGTRLADAILYYNARYLVKPGITGWAQINQQYEQNHISPQSIQETKTRLAYDFYYLKHRSLALDILIALKTVKRMFFRLSSV